MNSPTLDQLIIELANKKMLLDSVKQQISDIEVSIWGLVQPSITKLGTNNVHPRLKVVTKQTTTWDQEALHKMAAEIPSNYFPFKTEFKPDNKTLSALKAIDEDVYAKIMSAATVKDAKPSFEIVE